MKLTDRSVTFSDGSNSLVTHNIFEDEQGVEHVAVPGRIQRWMKVSDVKKDAHDPIRFLNNAHRKTGIPTHPTRQAEAFAQVQRNAGTSNPRFKFN